MFSSFPVTLHMSSTLSFRNSSSLDGGMVETSTGFAGDAARRYVNELSSAHFHRDA
uniref:Uncharacterized protein n=1 Tax=Anguilla anguilla TaxID=7936 RepID=A0A0E9QQQ1_ANGAN